MARLLIEAILNGEVTLAQDLIRAGTYGCVDSQTSRRDGTALFFCCSRGYLQLASMLIQCGANVNSENKSLARPLHAAADWGHVDIVRLLLEEKAEVNAKTHRGDTPLHLAAYRGHEGVARCLVEAGADVTALNSVHVTAEVEAQAQNHAQLAGFLRGVSPAQQPESVRDGQSSDLIFLHPPKEEPISSSQIQSRLPSSTLLLPCKQQQQQQQQQQQHQQSHHQPRLLPQGQRRRHSHSVYISPAPHSDISPPVTAPPCTRNPMSFFVLDPPIDTKCLHLKSEPIRRPVQTIWNLCPYTSQEHNTTQRRPSTCSTGSCISEVSGSDSLSSDVSSCQSESRRDDLDFPEHQSLLTLHPPIPYRPSSHPSHGKPPPHSPSHVHDSAHTNQNVSPFSNVRRISLSNAPSVSSPGTLRRLASIPATTPLRDVALAASPHPDFDQLFNSTLFSYSSMTSMTSSPLRSMSAGPSSGLGSSDDEFLAGCSLSSDLSSAMSTTSDDVKRPQNSLPSYQQTVTNTAGINPRQASARHASDSNLEGNDLSKFRPISTGAQTDQFSVCFPPSSPVFANTSLLPPCGDLRPLTSSSGEPDLGSNDLSSVTSTHSFLSSGGLPMNIPLN